MNILFKITSSLLDSIQSDLGRPHPFAHERVGFVSAGLSQTANQGILILAREYLPIEDEDYLLDHTVGALMGPNAIRRALEWSLIHKHAIFHVHSHGGSGLPSFSPTDIREHSRFILDFLKVSPQFIHGALVLSNTSASGVAFLDQTEDCIPIHEFILVGGKIKKWRHL